jgi:hypothetical protein
VVRHATPSYAPRVKPNAKPLAPRTFSPTVRQNVEGR